MSYAQVQDMQNRYPARDLVQLTDDEGETINPAKLQQFLDDASAEIDSYLEDRFALPFLDPPAILNQVCSDIAWYRLQVGRSLHDEKDADERFKSRIRWLESVRDGKTTVGMTADSKEPLISSPSVMTQSASPSPLYSDMFNRLRLGAF